MAQAEDYSDIHYLRHVTDLGERQRVVAHQAVFSSTGIKLVEAGKPITRSLLDKLAHHRLLPAIDECLTVENAVTAASLRDAAAALLDATPAFSALVAGKQRQRLLDAFAAIPLSAPLAFKLTVAREERPELFEHSLQVALLAVILVDDGEAASRESLVEAAAAGVFHDIGLLHVDPEIVKRTELLSEADRHHLYSHPIIGHLILSGVPEWSPRVADAVLQHHERLDGSGYPRGLMAAQIGELGQILAVAELGATLLAKNGGASRRHTEIVLRLNADQLPSRHGESLLKLLAKLPAPADSQGGSQVATVLPLLVRLSVAINHWRWIREGAADRHLMQFVDMRIERLSRALADVGIDLDYWGAFDSSLDDDPITLGEIEVVAREGNWQLCSIAQEIRRKWGQQLGTQASPELVGWLKAIESRDIVTPG